MKEELVVVIVGHGEVWQQVRTFVSSLRASYLPDQMPIVVFAPKRPPPNLIDEDFPGVLVVEGNCTSSTSLLEAGVLEAGAIVIMTGHATGTDGRETVYQDSRVVLCAQVLECWCGMSDNEVFTTYELQHSGSVRKLPKLMRKPYINLNNLLAAKSSLEEVEDEDCDFERRSGGTNSASTGNLSFASLDAGFGDDRDEARKTADEGSSVLYHPRFAAGQIFTPELWGAMLGCMFYMPAIIELVEALVMPHKRGQQAYPWQIRVPTAYVGRPYCELFSDLATCRRIECLGSGSCELPKAALGPAVAVALYRKRESDAAGETNFAAAGTGGHNYVILAPPPDTDLRWDDWIVVLGSSRLGRYMHGLHLLRGSKDCRKEKPRYPEDQTPTSATT